MAARARSRHELMMLSDHDLADMGLTRTDAEHEGDKPFWRRIATSCRDQSGASAIWR